MASSIAVADEHNGRGAVGASRSTRARQRAGLMRFWVTRTRSRRGGRAAARLSHATAVPFGRGSVSARCEFERTSGSSSTPTYQNNQTILGENRTASEIPLLICDGFAREEDDGHRCDREAIPAEASQIAGL